MNTYIIPQKMSNYGSAHDIGSDQFDRHIKFPKGHVYAVVCASYYGGKGYTTHKTEEGAIKASKKESRMGYSHDVIDGEGNTYTLDWEGLLIKI